MYVDITVPASLQLLCCQKEFLVQLLVKLIEYKAAFRGNEGAVRVGIFFIADIHYRLALFVHLVKHLHKILLIVAVITVAFCHLGIYPVKRSFDDIVHFSNKDTLLAHSPCLLFNETANEIQLFLCKLNKHTLCRFVYRNNDLLHVEILSCIVLLYYIHL